jgi:hypothetical protein
MTPVKITPLDNLVDSRGRPDFLWDTEQTLEEFLRNLRSGSVAARAYLLAKLMRQAKPDDVLRFVRPQEIADAWEEAQRYLGTTRPFWTWLVDRWKKLGRVRT